MIHKILENQNENGYQKYTVVQVCQADISGGSSLRLRQQAETSRQAVG
jgi:hypothetical protein